MTFKLQVRDSARRFSVQWTDGVLTGDEYAIDMLRLRAEVLDGTPIGPATGPFVEHDYLADPLATVFLAQYTFDEIISITGDVPYAPDVDEGAKA
jgi:hypothetical protein